MNKTDECFARGVKAYQDGDYETALREWTQAASLGDSTSMLNIGVLYANGQGVEKDRQTMALWTRKAAEAGSLSACHRLAKLYQHGDGVKCDSDAQWLWERKAAAAGYCLAMEDMARGYYFGSIGQKDPALAREWAEKAKAAGSGEMDQIISYCIRKEQEQEEERLHREALKKLPGGPEYLLGIEKLDAKETEAGIACLKAASEKGRTEADERLMQFYSRRGLRFKNPFYDPAQAVFYGSRCYQAGDKSACGKIASICLRAGSYLEALHWFQTAIEEGDTTAAERLKNEKKAAVDASLAALSKDDTQGWLRHMKKAVLLGETRIFLGQYALNKENEQEPIPWYVLEADESHVLAVSEICIARAPWNDAFSPADWEHSSIRKWLNEEFLPAAFGEGVRPYLKEGVFLLSGREAQILQERYPHGTAAGLSRQAVFAGEYHPREEKNVWWWLRSQGEHRMQAAVVTREGKTDLCGMRTYHPAGGVRPAVRITFSKHQDIAAL